MFGVILLLLSMCFNLSFSLEFAVMFKYLDRNLLIKLILSNLSRIISYREFPRYVKNNF